MWAAGEAAVARMPLGLVEVEAEASHAAADVLFRTLFSLPIEAEAAARAFRAHQRMQPLLNLAAFVRGGRLDAAALRARPRGRLARSGRSSPPW
jgi:hypothetical protein